jgi:NADPH:quinone reductase-like Zn-dependent oxidoreductase
MRREVDEFRQVVEQRVGPGWIELVGTAQRHGGRYVGGDRSAITVPVEPPPGIPLTAKRFVTRNDTSQLTALVKLIDAGAVRIDVAASRPLADLASVHRDAESGRTRGKIILIP